MSVGGQGGFGGGGGGGGNSISAPTVGGAGGFGGGGGAGLGGGIFVMEGANLTVAGALNVD